MTVAMNTAQLIAFFMKRAADESLSDDERFEARIQERLWREFHRTTVAPVPGNEPAPPRGNEGAPGDTRGQ